MNKQLVSKIKESLISVLPITLIVFVLNLTPLVDFSNNEIIVFIISAFFLILGIGLFNLGADFAMTSMGEQVGAGLTKTRNIWVLVFVCFMMGVLITVAEPDLTVLASQVKEIIDSTLLIIIVGVGVGLFLVLAILRIILKLDLSRLLMFFYLLIFTVVSLIVIQGKESFLSLAFDSGGVTTGPVTVPFIMALGIGIALSISGKNANENSFGLVAFCSIGPILAVLFLGLMSNGEIDYQVSDYSLSNDLFSHSLSVIFEVSRDVFVALGLVVSFFFIIQFFCLKLPKKKLIQILIGTLYTYFGLVIFLTSVNVGFMPIGYKMGVELASSSPNLLIFFGFFIGLVVVLAEPSVHVLNKQVEEITDGMITKKQLLVSLSVGVGLSIGLSMLRIIYDFNLLYVLVPGYLLSLGLSFFVPRIYTAIAFDSGGVASGPLTSTFVLPFAIGATLYLHGESSVLNLAFGIVAFVAMTPLITIQILGFKSIVMKKFRERLAMRRILLADDEQIIDFM